MFRAFTNHLWLSSLHLFAVGRGEFDMGKAGWAGVSLERVSLCFLGGRGRLEGFSRESLATLKKGGYLSD